MKADSCSPTSSSPTLEWGWGERIIWRALSLLQGDRTRATRVTFRQLQGGEPEMLWVRKHSPHWKDPIDQRALLYHTVQGLLPHCQSLLWFSCVSSGSSLKGVLTVECGEREGRKGRGEEERKKKFYSAVALVTSHLGNHP